MKGSLCSVFAVFVYRFGEATDSAKCKDWIKSFGFILRPSFHIIRFFSVALCKIFFQEGTKLGKGVSLSSKGNIIVGAESIGNDCVIHHNVTFGMHLAGNDSTGKPKVADRVWIGPNTIIYGNIKIGEGVTILGRTVLTKNVPDRCVVSGNPGRIVNREFDNARLLKSSRYDVSMQTLQEWTVSDDQ